MKSPRFSPVLRLDHDFADVADRPLIEEARRVCRAGQIDVEAVRAIQAFRDFIHMGTVARQDLRWWVRPDGRKQRRFPGQYAVMSDGEPLCRSCCRKEWRNVYRAMIDNENGDSWWCFGIETHHDGDFTCSHCGVPYRVARPEGGMTSC